MSEWQPIETAPRDGTEFLAYDPVVNKYDVCYASDNRWYGPRDDDDLPYFIHQVDGDYGSCDDYFNGDRATHWMPLPEPPEETP